MADLVKVERFNVDTFLSNTYLVYTKHSLEVNEAIVIDPHFSDDLRNRLEELKIDKVLVFLTHEHFDHTTGVNWVKKYYQGELWCQTICAEKIASVRNNRPLSVMNVSEDIKKYYYAEHYTCESERSFEERDEYMWHGTIIRFVHTPGHTSGSCCIEIGRNVFTGDSLIIDEKVMTRFPSGSMDDYLNISLEYLLSLESDLDIFPGHGISGVKMKELIYKNGRFIRKEGQ